MTAHSETKKKTQQQQLKNAYSARIFNIMVISIHSKVNQHDERKKKKKTPRTEITFKAFMFK